MTNMTSTSDLKEEILSRVDIRQILQEFGIPYKESYGRVIFSLRKEKSPSCSAIFDGNCWRWRDFGDPSLRGTVIHLYSFLKYGKCSFSWDVVREMAERLHSSLSPLPVGSSLPCGSVDRQGRVRVTAVLDDFLNAQKRYLKGRGVYPLPSHSPVYPVLYEYRGKRWYGLGMKTLSGGWLIRQTLKRENFARYLFSGKADISFWEGQNEKLVVVEGMFDALSLRVLRKETDNVVILNSVALYRRFLDWVRGRDFRRIILALDNDEAGRRTALRLRGKLSNASILKYEGKDLNDLLIGKGLCAK